MLKESLEQIAHRYYEDIIYILKSNNEQYTENNNGYFFDLTKLKDETVAELKLFVQKKPNDEISAMEHRKSFALQQPEQNKELMEVNDKKRLEYITKSEVTNGTNVTPSQKFISEYNIDFNKTTEKASTLLKFLNAKKKYIRNPETLLSKNEAQLKKQSYAL